MLQCAYGSTGGVLPCFIQIHTHPAGIKGGGILRVLQHRVYFLPVSSSSPADRCSRFAPANEPDKTTTHHTYIRGRLHRVILSLSLCLHFSGGLPVLWTKRVQQLPHSEAVSSKDCGIISSLSKQSIYTDGVELGCLRNPSKK